MYVEAHLLISISGILESGCLCPKVIPLSGFHCKIINSYIEKFFMFYGYVETRV
jgi:hypothetical protein